MCVLPPAGSEDPVPGPAGPTPVPVPVHTQNVKILIKKINNILDPFYFKSDWKRLFSEDILWDVYVTTTRGSCDPTVELCLFVSHPLIGLRYWQQLIWSYQSLTTPRQKGNTAYFHSNQHRQTARMVFFLPHQILRSFNYLLVQEVKCQFHFWGGLATGWNTFIYLFIYLIFFWIFNLKFPTLSWTDVAHPL